MLFPYNSTHFKSFCYTCICIQSRNKIADTFIINKKFVVRWGYRSAVFIC